MRGSKPRPIPPGTQFGSLTVIREVERGPVCRNGQRHRRFLCRCRCGGESIYWRGNLSRSLSTQCKACGYIGMRKTERDAAIVAAYMAGHSIEDLAREHGLDPKDINYRIIPPELRCVARPVWPVGTRFGRWTVAGAPKVRKFTSTTARYYPCRCACGTRRLVSSSALSLGSSKSCGCSLQGPQAWRHTGPDPAKVGRNAEIAMRAERGDTIAEIAREFGLTRQRVHQIVNGR